MKSRSPYMLAETALLYIILLILFASPIDAPGAEVLQKAVQVEVDASQREPLPEIYRPSISLEGRGSPHHVYPADSPVMKKFEREVGFSGTFRFYIWLQRTGIGPGNEVQLREYLPWLKRVQEGGAGLSSP